MSIPTSACPSRLPGVAGMMLPQQLQQLSDLQAAGVSGIAISPINLPEIERKINELVAAGIKVITVNSDIENTGRLCYVGCNYYQSGITAGGMLRLMRPEGVRAGIVTGSIRMLGHNRRMKGFSDAVKQLPDSAIADVCESLDEQEVAYEETPQDAHGPSGNQYPLFRGGRRGRRDAGGRWTWGSRA